MALDPFVGQRDFPVAQEDRRLSAAECDTILAHFVKGRERGNIDGPRSYRPFANTRDCPNGTKAKHRYIESSELCVTTDAASTWRATASVNKLTWSPHIRRAHLQAFMIRDLMAWLGRGATVSILDIPKCFRTNKTNPSLYHLFVYRVVTSEFGEEFWTDMANPFGWIASEWGWACCLAIIEWIMHKAGVRRQCVFVDNFFNFHLPPPGFRDPHRPPNIAAPPARSPVDRAPLEEAARVDDIIDSLGLGSHEQLYAVTTFPGMGWIWHWEHPGEWSMAMECPHDKYASYMAAFRAWAVATHIAVTELEQAVGIMNWLRAGFPIGAASMSAISNLATKGVALCKSHDLSRAHKMMKVSEEAHDVFSFWTDRLARWDRVCPIVMGFGPCSLPDVRGWVDACSWNPGMPPGERGGCGGVLFDPIAGTLLGFVHEWTDDERSDAERVERESVPFYEALGIAWWMRLYAARCRAKRLLLASDSATATQAFKRGFSGEGGMNRVVRAVRMTLAEDFITWRLRAIVGDRFNRVADLLSHGLVDEACSLATEEFGARLLVCRV